MSEPKEPKKAWPWEGYPVLPGEWVEPVLRRAAERESKP